MDNITIFEIYLKKKKAMYMAGKTVRGHLVIRTKERLEINSLKVSLTGKARVYWSERRGGDSQYTKEEIVVYSADDNYLNSEMFLLAHQEKNDACLEVGDHLYPFQIKLPQKLPSSFEYESSRIEYRLEGQIDFPWAEKMRVEKIITVVCPLDLNRNPELNQPISEQNSKTLCCWCCKSEPITATLNILKGGCVSGEAIVFNAVIDNKSSREIKHLKLELVQKISLHATKKSRIKSKIIAEISCSKRIAANSCDEWKDAVLTVPPVDFTSYQTCRIIEVQYFVALNVYPAGLSLCFDVSIPIVIGIPPSTPIHENSTKS